MVVINLFSQTISIGKQMLEYERLIDELRNVEFALEKDINLGNGILTNPSDLISYPECDTGVANMCTALRIADKDGNEVKYYLDVLLVKKDTTKPGFPTETISLTTEQIQVDTLFFHVERGVTGSGLPSEQPRATVTIEAKAMETGIRSIKTQTTISEKGY